MRPRRKVKCPSCGADMPTEQYRAGEPWTCPRCSRQFQISRAYGNIITWGAMVLSLVFFSLLGLRGFRLFIAVIVMWFPVLLILTGLFNHIFTPPLESYKPKDDLGPKGSGSNLFLR
jgi:DNA-directed RNA polymerase subunit RPC12/RpoP